PVRATHPPMDLPAGRVARLLGRRTRRRVTRPGARSGRSARTARSDRCLRTGPELSVSANGTRDAPHVHEVREIMTSGRACEYARLGYIRVRPFILLQLSDLHFGPHSRFGNVDMSRLAERCAEALRDAKTQLGWK